jgi:hypothetical protein
LKARSHGKDADTRRPSAVCHPAERPRERVKRKGEAMETDPGEMPDDRGRGEPDPDESMPEQPMPDQERQAPEGGGGTTAPVPGNPDIGGA